MAAATGALAGMAIQSSTVHGVTAAVLAPQPVDLAFNGRLLRGTADGRVLESGDNGQTWQQTADFGSHCAVLDLMERDGQVFAKVGLRNMHFTLSSPDARVWRTLRNSAA
ncbi:hypothetical protein LARV_00347 [Longilinea arvoryzae]|uniref:Uncharacterized protein n=2 Tax=Longilinea arvoryzae TaxID=360412 RepID=A0A0S7BDR5_9CHLR|nr:hypothetical protein LARV_00347 [Longilinea arvoryzae]